MSQSRTACTSCELPFYSEENETCPYCGATAGSSGGDADDGSTTDGETEERTTCPDCGLPHYADAVDCPYCEQSGDAGDGTPAETSAGADAGGTSTGAGDGASEAAPTADPTVETADGSGETDAVDEPARRAATEPEAGREPGGLIARVKRLFRG